VLLIYDEIITGFGRTGRLFGAERVGAWPDILTCGKGISGGYAPLSAILIADRVSEAFWGEPEAGCSSGRATPLAATQSRAPLAKRRCAT
jgi:adenosylmethionine-8-amino-7-oxononanoate aminotransferase